VKLLEAEPAVAPAPEAQAPPQTTPEAPPAPPESGRACKTCGAPMDPEQDWCLSCGTAAPGSLGGRPGWRAASTVVALTALLVLGAIGAGYAAMNDNGKAPATASTGTQAQVPPAATTPPAATPPATSSLPTTSAPVKPKKSTIPKVTTPTPSSSAATPITPAPVPTPTPSTPAATTPPVTTTPPADTSTTPSTPATTTPAPPAPVAVKVPATAGQPYDPYKRLALSGDPTRALDGDPGTSWFADPTSPQLPGLGYVVELPKKHGLSEVDLTTATPGFKVEVYASTDATPPPNILDSRWSHVGNAAKVKKDQKITLIDDPTKYRNVLLWFTLPPTSGARIRLSEVKFLD
jgi:hypothetical protein